MKAKYTPGYHSWRSAKRRCLDSSDKDYPRYGGAGVSFCDSWVSSFWNFYNDMGPAPDGCSLDRIDGGLGYSPENCRWATAVEQANNKITSRRFPEFDNKTLREITMALGKNRDYQLIKGRLWRGWSLEEALLLPKGARVERLPSPESIIVNALRIKQRKLSEFLFRKNGRSSQLKERFVDPLLWKKRGPQKQC